MQQPEEHEKEEEVEEELEDEELIDEDNEESSDKKFRVGSSPTSRVVTLQMLLSSGVLEPGEGTMAIEYLGQRFVGDLLPDGKIKSQETGIVFASPSAWATSCKRIINPEKKSGCGWASIKCRGKKLDIYKNAYLKKKKEVQEKEFEIREVIEDNMDKKNMAPPTPPMPLQRVVMKHGVIGNKGPHLDTRTLVECTPFSTLGKIQPFLVSMSTNAALVMDLHCHLTSSEVVGYLGGHWDVNSHTLSITHAFPCRCRLTDTELAPMVEAEVRRTMEQLNLTLVGWYHSHPTYCATPSLKDIDSQLEYEIKMKGNSDASYTPCVGIICSPYNKESHSFESSIICYWVSPPPETRPQEYGKPMLMSYTVVQDQYLSQEALNDMKKCIDFYKNEKDYIKFWEIFKQNTTYLEKIKATLTSKFPRDHTDGILWNFIQDLLCPRYSECRPGSEISGTICATPATPEHVSLLVPTFQVPVAFGAIPSNTSSASIPPSIMPATVIGSDFASTLFTSGKFSAPASLMGFSVDPSKTVLGSGNLTAGNMYIPPMSFKLDNVSILKPVGTTSTATSTTKVSSSRSTNTIPSSVKISQADNKQFLVPDSSEKMFTAGRGQHN